MFDKKNLTTVNYVDKVIEQKVEETRAKLTNQSASDNWIFLPVS